jgi:hypothetical protein
VGDVLGEFGEVHPVWSPQRERLLSGRDESGGVVLAPSAARAGDQKPAQAGLAEPDHRVRVGVATQELQRSDAIVRPQYRIPSGAEEFDERVEPRVDRDPTLDHRGALLDQTTQRVRRPLAGVLPQPFGMQQRQPGQQFGVDPVVLGVLGVVLAQVRGLGGRDHHHPCAATAEPLRDHDPCVPGWLDDHGQLTGVSEVEIGPEPLQIGWSCPELPAPPHRGAVVRERGLMRRPDRNVDAQRQRHLVAPVSRNPDHEVTDRRGHGPDIL